METSILVVLGFFLKNLINTILSYPTNQLEKWQSDCSTDSFVMGGLELKCCAQLISFTANLTGTIKLLPPLTFPLHIDSLRVCLCRQCP